MDCKNPCDEYRKLKRKIETSLTDSGVVHVPEYSEKRLTNYCRDECPHPGERAKNLLQKL
ncbi:MAG: hypothetical protein ABIH28_03225 [archaeon]